MTLPEILGDLPRVVREVSAEDLPALVGRLAEAHAVAMARLVTPGLGVPSTQAEEPDRLLTPGDALGLLGGGVSLKWLYRHTRGLRFRRDLSRKEIRFEERGFRRWLQAR